MGLRANPGPGSRPELLLFQSNTWARMGADGRKMPGRWPAVWHAECSYRGKGCARAAGWEPGACRAWVWFNALQPSEWLLSYWLAERCARMQANRFRMRLRRRLQVGRLSLRFSRSKYILLSHFLRSQQYIQLSNLTEPGGPVQCVTMPLVIRTNRRVRKNIRTLFLRSICLLPQPIRNRITPRATTASWAGPRMRLPGFFLRGMMRAEAG